MRDFFLQKRRQVPFNIFRSGPGHQPHGDRDCDAVFRAARFKTVAAGQRCASDFDLIGELVELPGIRILRDEVFFTKAQEIIASFVFDQLLQGADVRNYRQSLLIKPGHCFLVNGNSAFPELILHGFCLFP